MRRRHAALAMLASLGTPFARIAHAAETWPAHAVRLIVPSGAGGVTDILARTVAERLSQMLGQPFVVINRTGGSGMIGSNEVATAAADGYTLLFAYPSHTINPSLQARMPYDTVRDFAPVSTVGSVSALVTVRADSPLKDLNQLIAMARRKPGTMSYGIVGIGSLGHIAAERFTRIAELNMITVPYTSAPQGQAALLAGDLDVFVDVPITALPLIHGGRVRGLAVSTAERLSALPDVPTIGELLPGYGETSSFNAVLAPAGTSNEVVARLNGAIAAVLRDPAVQASFREKGVEPMGSTADALAARIRDDIAKWKDVVRVAGIKID